MAKIYSTKVINSTSQPMQPSAKTVKAILDFSKALKVVNYKGMQFECLQN
jgi:hypothetical protein